MLSTLTTADNAKDGYSFSSLLFECGLVVLSISLNAHFSLKHRPQRATTSHLLNWYSQHTHFLVFLYGTYVKNTLHHLPLCLTTLTLPRTSSNKMRNRWPTQASRPAHHTENEEEKETHHAIHIISTSFRGWPTHIRLTTNDASHKSNFLSRSL